MNWYIGVLKKYAVFGGRARRKEYWMFFLFNILVLFTLAFVEGLARVAPGSDATVLATLYMLGVLIPGVAVAVRRLHDTDRSAWWLLIGLVPFIGGIVLFVFMVQDSHPSGNQYGPNPKTAVAA